MICPKCKAEIDTDSCYCDQCGQEMRYCQSCQKLGKGNRCTACGGRMVPAIEYFKNPVLPVTSEVNSASSGDGCGHCHHQGTGIHAVGIVQRSVGYYNRRCGWGCYRTTTWHLSILVLAFPLRIRQACPTAFRPEHEQMEHHGLALVQWQ